MKDGVYNAIIVATDIVYEPDRDFWQVMITVDYEFGHQAFCGVMAPQLVGIVACRVMETVGSNSFKNLVGMHCRIEMQDQSIYGIGCWNKNRWFRKSDLDQGDQ